MQNKVGIEFSGEFDSFALTNMLDEFSNDRDFFILQIGANDGIESDPVRHALVKNKWSALLIEPQPEFFERLRHNYKDVPSIRFQCCAIAEYAGEIDLFRIPPELIFSGTFKPWMGGCASLYLDRGPFSKGDAKWGELLNAHLTNIRVSCLTLADVISQNNIPRIDVFVVDAEGGDWMILKQLDLRAFTPKFILYEFSHLNNDERLDSITHLRASGYCVYINNTRTDVLAVRE